MSDTNNVSRLRQCMMEGGEPRHWACDRAARGTRRGQCRDRAAKTVEPHPKLKGTIFTAADEVRAAAGNALPVICDIRDEPR